MATCHVYASVRLQTGIVSYTLSYTLDGATHYQYVSASGGEVDFLIDRGTSIKLANANVSFGPNYSFPANFYYHILSTDPWIYYDYISATGSITFSDTNRVSVYVQLGNATYNPQPTTYTVTLYYNDGSSPETYTTQTGESGTSITKTASRTNYTFLGWFTDRTGGTKVTTITQNQTLYAHWGYNPLITPSLGANVTSCRVHYTNTSGEDTYAILSATSHNAFRCYYNTPIIIYQYQSSSDRVVINTSIPDGGLPINFFENSSWVTSLSTNGQIRRTYSENSSIKLGGEADFHVVYRDGSSILFEDDLTSYHPTKSFNLREGPTKTGYVFSKWRIDSIDYDSGASYSFTEPKTVQAQAQWVYAPAHTITLYRGVAVSRIVYQYTYQGQSSGDKILTGSSVSFSADEGTSVKIRSATPASGYSYPVNVHESDSIPGLTYGWVGSIDSSTDTFDATIGSKDLYLRVGSLAYYEIRYYDSDGTTELSLTPTSETSYNCPEMDVALTTTIPTKSGFRFKEWHVNGAKPQGNIVHFTRPSIVHAVAQWERGVVYHLSYNSDGGSYTPPDQYYPEDQSLTTDTEHSFVIPAREPSKIKWTFNGWKFSDDLTLYRGGATVRLLFSAPDRQLQAQWIAYSQTFTLKFRRPDGSQIFPDKTFTTTNPAEQSFTFDIYSERPEKEGYVFLGWSTNASATSADYFPGGKFTVGLEHPTMSLFAVWMSKCYGRIHYHFDGGSMEVPTSVTPVRDEWRGPTEERGGPGYDTVYVTINTVTKSGYRLLHWADSPMEAMASHIYNPADLVHILCESTNPNSPTETHLYAIWTSWSGDIYGRFNFKSQSSTGDGHFYVSGTVIEDIYSYPPESLPQPGGMLSPIAYKKVSINPSVNPIATGKTFIGWSTSYQATKPSYQNGDTYDMMLGSIDSERPTENVLYAVYTNQDLTLTLHANGGTFDQFKDPCVISTEYGKQINLGNYSVSRSGYKFLGWHPDPNAKAPLYPPDYVYTMTYINLDWYAVWGNNQIPEFNWTSNDDVNIQPGEEVANVLASKWNELRGLIAQMGSTDPPGEEAQSQSSITALQFNIIRNGIYGLPGGGFDMPFAAKGSDVLASMFYSSTSSVHSLKKCINSAIEYYNRQNN